MISRRTPLVKTMFPRKWKKVSQAEFLIRVGQCLEKGYTLRDAIRLQTYEQPRQIKLRASQMLQDLKNGEAVSDVFLKAGFPQESCSFLFFSMQTGQLSNGFFEGGRYLKLKEAQRDNLNKLMRYPLFLMWIFMIMVYIVLNQLLPSFKQLYEAMSIDLPYSVKIMLAIPAHLGTLLLILLIVIGIVTLLITVYIRKFSLQQRLTHTARVPYISTFLKMYLSYYFAFHLGGLLRVGLSVNQALQLIEHQRFQPFFRAEALKMRESLVNGYTLTDLISQRLYYTKDLTMVIQNGEAQGQLGINLQDYSQIVLNHLEDKITRAFAKIQPLFFMLFGGLIVALFLSILTPMFSILKGM